MAKAAADKLTLEVKKRELFGKKLNRLRKTGFIPANIFGPDFKSVSISVAAKNFFEIYKTAKETGVVYLELDQEKLPVLIKHLQFHPVYDQLLHVDFRKIDLQKKVETAVPVKFINTSEAVTQKGGVLLTLSETLNVEALPQDIPPAIEVDIAVLKDIPQEIKVKDLKTSNKYEIKEDPEKIVVSVVAHKEESVVAETAATATPEVITAKVEEGAEAPAEAAVPEGKKPETAKPPTKPAAKTEEKK